MNQLLVAFALTFVLICMLLYLCIKANRELVIPKTIWQTYKSSKLPKKAIECQASWKNQKDYSYNFMDDNEIDEFMRKNFSNEIVEVFNSLPLGVMKADMWRYCVLFVYGGVYSDIDSLSIRPIEEWGINSNNRILIGLENDTHFCQWTIVSEPRHPILKKVIELIVEKARSGFDTTYEHFVHDYTGPGIWTRAVNASLGFPENEKALNVYKNRHTFTGNGVRLEDDKFFSGKNVNNLYGSTQFGDGYISWTTERDALLASS